MTPAEILLENDRNITESILQVRHACSVFQALDSFLVWHRKGFPEQLYFPVTSNDHSFSPLCFCFSMSRLETAPLLSHSTVSRSIITKSWLHQIKHAVSNCVNFLDHLNSLNTWLYPSSGSQHCPPPREHHKFSSCHIHTHRGWEVKGCNRSGCCKNISFLNPSLQFGLV